MIVSMVGGTAWAVRRSDGRAVSNPSPMPTARPTALLEQINPLVQRIGRVPGGVIPFRKIQGRVHPAGDLPQAARREGERTVDRVRSQRAAQTGHGPVGGDARGRGTERVGYALPQLACVPQIQREGERVLVSLADGRIEVEP